MTKKKQFPKLAWVSVVPLDRTQIDLFFQTQLLTELGNTIGAEKSKQFNLHFVYHFRNTNYNILREFPILQ